MTPTKQDDALAKETAEFIRTKYPDYSYAMQMEMCRAVRAWIRHKPEPKALTSGAGGDALTGECDGGDLEKALFALRCIKKQAGLCLELGMRTDMRFIIEQADNAIEAISPKTPTTGA